MEIHRQLQRNRLAGVVAVVTGISGSTGSAIARRFAAEGARLVVAGPDGPVTRETMHEIDAMGGTALLVEADARTENGARQITHAAMQRYGRIDTLVHSLDLLPIIHEASSREEGIDINISGFFPMVFAGASAMWLQGEGSIVLAALLKEGGPSDVDPLVQATARAGLASFVHAAATTLYAQGISVNAVELEDHGTAANGAPKDPGAAHLNFVNAYRKARRFEDVAQTARFLASSEARGITGQVLFVGGGSPPSKPAYALSPQSLHRMETVYRSLFSNLDVAAV